MQKVSIVKCSSYGQKEVYAAVKKSIDLIGGLNIKPGSKVLVKPNMLRPRHPKYAVTTNPEVIRAVIKLLKQRKCKILVGDSPGFHPALTTAKVSGILDLCKQENVPFAEFKNKKTYPCKDAILMKRFTLADIIDKVDYIISVPKLKTHVMMGVTFAVKNTFGFIIGLNKSQMHLKLRDKDKFASMLVDLNSLIKPTINIMDGVIGMEGNGPGAGDIKKAGIISASYDSLAMDIIMCRLVGFDPLKIRTNKIALSRKEKDFIKNINVVGDNIPNLKFKPATQKELTFILPEGFAKVIDSLTTARPRINKVKCKACGECIKICPAKAIDMKDCQNKKAAYINKEKCIRCFCCHEICHYHAIDIRKSLLGTILEKLRLV